MWKLPRICRGARCCFRFRPFRAALVCTGCLGSPGGRDKLVVAGGIVVPEIHGAGVDFGAFSGSIANFLRVLLKRGAFGGVAGSDACKVFGGGC